MVKVVVLGVIVLVIICVLVFALRVGSSPTDIKTSDKEQEEYLKKLRRRKSLSQ